MAIDLLKTRKAAKWPQRGRLLGSPGWTPEKVRATRWFFDAIHNNGTFGGESFVGGRDDGRCN
jgi:hypothetical protein